MEQSNYDEIRLLVSQLGSQESQVPNVISAEECGKGHQNASYKIYFMRPPGVGPPMFERSNITKTDVLQVGTQKPATEIIMSNESDVKSPRTSSSGDRVPVGESPEILEEINKKEESPDDKIKDDETTPQADQNCVEEEPEICGNCEQGIETFSQNPTVAQETPEKEDKKGSKFSFSFLCFSCAVFD